MKKGAITKKQEKTIAELLKDYKIKIHGKTPNTFKCIELILSEKVSIWIDLRGRIFYTGFTRLKKN